jgi:hypothetical protein
MWTDVDRALVAMTIADCLPAVAFGEGGRIDDWRLKRTAATRRLQIHRDLDIAHFGAHNIPSL